MIQLTEDRLEDVLTYMEDDLPNCLYLYGDIVRYGVDDPNMTVWFSEKDGDINAVVMKYFMGSHVYSKKLDCDLDEIEDKLREINVDRISSQREIIEMLSTRMIDKYDVKYGCILKYQNYRNLKSPVLIERASVSDVEAIANLLLTDENMAAAFRREDLVAQHKNRIQNHIGRSYIIREGNRIVAHSSISIETNAYAILAQTMVHKDYRKTLYGSFIDSFMINDLGKEGKELYGMVVEGRRLDGLVRMGNLVQAKYGKLIRRDH